MEIKTEKQILEDNIYLRPTFEYEKRWINAKDMKKELDMFFAELLLVERGIPINVSKNITKLCVKFAKQFEKSLSKTQANPKDLSANKDFTASPKVCPNCKEEVQPYINDEGEKEERCYCS